MPSLPQQPVTRSESRLLAVDVLRGLAALAVVLTHIPRQHHGEFDWLYFAFLPLDFGTLGVPLFIVLSGFCIHLGVARRAANGRPPHLNWGQFWKRRFVRLYPPYVAAILFSLSAYGIVVAAGHPHTPLTSIWSDLAVHLTMVQNVMPAYMPGLFNPAFWTLALEEQLYALFALVLVLRRRLPIVKVLSVALLVTLAWRIGTVWIEFGLAHFYGVARDSQLIELPGLPQLGGWGYWVFGWWFLWVLGAVAAEAHAGAIRLPRWCYNPMVAVACAIIGAPIYFRTLGVYTTYFLTDEGARGWLRVALETIGSLSEPLFAVTCFVLLNTWCRAEREGRFAGRAVRAAAACGVMSYSLYLIHMPTIQLLEQFVPIGQRQDFLYAPLRILVYVPICLGVAFLFFRFVERPFLHQSRTVVQTPPSRAGLAYETT